MYEVLKGEIRYKDLDEALGIQDFELDQVCQLCGEDLGVGWHRNVVNHQVGYYLQGEVEGPEVVQDSFKADLKAQLCDN